MTDVLDVGSLVHADGFFLVRKKVGQPAAFVPTGADAMSRYRHVFTYEGSGTTIKELAVELIGLAGQKVFQPGHQRAQLHRREWRGHHRCR